MRNCRNCFGSWLKWTRKTRKGKIRKAEKPSGKFRKKLKNRVDKPENAWYNDNVNKGRKTLKNRKGMLKMTVAMLMEILSHVSPDAVVEFDDTYTQCEGYGEGHENATLVTWDVLIDRDNDRVVLHGE